MPKEIIFESLLIPDDQDDQATEQDGLGSIDSGLATAQDERKNGVEVWNGVAWSPARKQDGSPSTSVQFPSSTFPNTVEASQPDTQNEVSSCSSNVVISRHTELKGWEQYSLQLNSQESPSRNSGMTATSINRSLTRFTGPTRGHAPATPGEGPGTSHQPREGPYQWLDRDPPNGSASNHSNTTIGHGIKMPWQRPSISDAATAVIVRSDGVPSGSGSRLVPSSSVEYSDETPSRLELTIKFHTLAMLQSQRDRLQTSEGAGRDHCGYWTPYTYSCTDPLTYQHIMSDHFLPDAMRWYQSDFRRDRLPDGADTILPNAATARIVAEHLFHCTAEGCGNAFLTRDALNEHRGEQQGDMSTVERDMGKEGKMLLELLVHVWQDELRDQRRS